MSSTSGKSAVVCVTATPPRRPPGPALCRWSSPSFARPPPEQLDERSRIGQEGTNATENFARSRDWGVTVDTSFRDFFDRYGPTLAMIVAIVLLVVLVPGNAHTATESSDVSAAADATGAAGSSGATAAGAQPGTAGTPGAANAAGTPGVTGTPGATSAGGQSSTVAAGGAAPVAGETGSYPCRSDQR